MITSAKEYFNIVNEVDGENYDRVLEESSDEVWCEILSTYGFEEHVIQNNTISPLVLDVLSKSDSDTVRSQVAEKRRLMRSTFERLANDPLPWVRTAIACNKKCPRDILEVLTKDSDTDVVEAAMHHFGG